MRVEDTTCNRSIALFVVPRVRRYTTIYDEALSIECV